MLKPIIIKRTLCGPEQPPRCLYRIEENCAISGIFLAPEIPELLTGIPAMGDEEITFIDAIGDMKLKPETIISRCSTDTEQTAALRCKAEFVQLSISVSDLYSHHLRLSRAWVLSLIARLIRKIGKCHTGISICMLSLGSAYSSFLVEVALCPSMCGEQRIQFSNKVGAILPFAAYDLIARLHDAVDLEKKIYLQNCVGLATAHTLAALNSSAPHVNPAVKGMVHPKGKAALEEVVTGSQHLLGQDTGVDRKTLVQISPLVKDAFDRTVPSNRIRTRIGSHRARSWNTHSRVSHFDSRLSRCDKHDSLLSNTRPHPDYQDSGNSEAVFRERVVKKMVLSLHRERRWRYPAKPIIPFPGNRRRSM
ncbi:Homocitrate synthase (plasmid) [Cupriavidus taiwanensis]|uniref:homocitrate synthase n=1 Tax=Cupriavidus taiwanensis TaxID=164546 RepID=UPI000E102222|nr:homocitrate synthase [Cupriavidus taiwanensis]SPA11339.1 Homocitrate synthase [Cupriavidus taiwanensis]